jgi:hypothetical protein
MSDERALLRHTIATLAYRAEKVLRDPPDGFADKRVTPGTRTPVEIVSHLGDLMEWGTRMAQGDYKWIAGMSTDWKGACDRFFAGIAAFDAAVSTSTFAAHPPGVIFQGPIADALTHIGQLAMLRNMSGGPIKPESYARAEIQSGRVGTDQSAKRKEFEGDASGPRPKRD